MRQWRDKSRPTAKGIASGVLIAAGYGGRKEWLAERMAGGYRLWLDPPYRIAQRCITVTLSNGTVVNTIPDLAGRRLGGGYGDLKNVVNLRASRQLNAQIAIARNEKVPFNLVVSSRTQKISASVQSSVDSTGGSIWRFDDAKGAITPW